MNGNNEIQKNEALLAKLKGLQSAIKEVRYDDGYNINQISGICKNAVIHLKSLTTSDSDDAELIRITLKDLSSLDAIVTKYYNDPQYADFVLRKSSRGNMNIFM